MALVGFFLGGVGHRTPYMGIGSRRGGDDSRDWWCVCLRPRGGSPRGVLGVGRSLLLGFTLFGSVDSQAPSPLKDGRSMCPCSLGG